MSSLLKKCFKILGAHQIEVTVSTNWSHLLNNLCHQIFCWNFPVFNVIITFNTYSIFMKILTDHVWILLQPLFVKILSLLLSLLLLKLHNLMIEVRVIRSECWMNNGLSSWMMSLEEYMIFIFNKMSETTFIGGALSVLIIYNYFMSIWVYTNFTAHFVQCYGSNNFWVPLVDKSYSEKFAFVALCQIPF